MYTEELKMSTYEIPNDSFTEVNVDKSVVNIVNWCTLGNVCLQLQQKQHQVKNSSLRVRLGAPKILDGAGSYKQRNLLL